MNERNFFYLNVKITFCHHIKYLFLIVFLFLLFLVELLQRFHIKTKVAVI